MPTHTGPNIIEDGLVLHLDAADRGSYPGSGTTWYNLSGKTNNSILTNGAFFNSSNLGGISFDGVDDYIEIESMTPYQLLNTDKVTIGITFKFNSFSTGRSYIFENRAENNNNPFPIFVDRNSTQEGILKIYTGVEKPITTLYSERYYNIIYTIDNTNSVDNIKFYVNAIEQLPNSYTYGSSPNTSLSMYLGRAFPISGYRFYGEIYNFLFYNKILTSQEVLQNYNATKSRFNL